MANKLGFDSLRALSPHHLSKQKSSTLWLFIWNPAPKQSSGCTFRAPLANWDSLAFGRKSITSFDKYFALIISSQSPPCPTRIFHTHFEIRHQFIIFGVYHTKATLFFWRTYSLPLDHMVFMLALLFTSIEQKN